MLGPLSYLDYILLIIALISGVLAMYRGLTREVLSILSWALAAVAALFFAFNYRYVSKDVAISLGVDERIALGLCVVGLFILVLIVVHFITSKFSEMVLDSRIGALDRTLGFVFGLARGFILVVIAYFFFTFVYQDEEKHFYWITQSKSLPYIKQTSEFISDTMQKVVPEKIKLPDKDPEPEQQSLNVRPENNLREAQLT